MSQPGQLQFLAHGVSFLLQFLVKKLLHVSETKAGDQKVMAKM
jgi:hypothetical protein